MYSYYFSTVTMLTIGYGDISPQTPIEIIIWVFIMFFSTGIFGYTLNTIN